MSGSNQNHRDARTIEADLARNRAELDATVDKLQYKFRPGELFDQAWRYARSRNTGESDSRMKDSLVRNPLPVALIGVGFAWLMLAGRNGSVPSRQLSTRQHSPSADGAAGSTASGSPSAEPASASSVSAPAPTGVSPRESSEPRDSARGSKATAGSFENSRPSDRSYGSGDDSRPPHAPGTSSQQSKASPIPAPPGQSTVEPDTPTTSDRPDPADRPRRRT